jgi:type IV secretory pathway VirB3-like protein
VGYSSLLLGVPLDLLGVLDMAAGAGMALFVPGGLFEFVVLPLWLIAKGFRSATEASRTDATVLVAAR